MLFLPTPRLAGEVKQVDVQHVVHGPLGAPARAETHPQTGDGVVALHVQGGGQVRQRGRGAAAEAGG